MAEGGGDDEGARAGWSGAIEMTLSGDLQRERFVQGERGLRRKRSHEEVLRSACTYVPNLDVDYSPLTSAANPVLSLMKVQVAARAGGLARVSWVLSLSSGVLGLEMPSPTATSVPTVTGLPYTTVVWTSVVHGVQSQCSHTTSHHMTSQVKVRGGRLGDLFRPARSRLVALRTRPPMLPRMNRTEQNPDVSARARMDDTGVLVCVVACPLAKTHLLTVAALPSCLTPQKQKC